MELFDKAVQRTRDWIAEFKPVAVVGLLSGGHDSMTANLVAHEAGATASLHVNTGIGIERTRDYVRQNCADRNWKLAEYKAVENIRSDGIADPQNYDDLVRRFGFPGPASHRFMYARLKERQLRRFERDVGATSKTPVIYISGCRRDESVRRMGNVVDKPQREGRRVWLSSIYDFTKSDCSRCMEHHGVKRNEVVDLIHKSGECLCGAFADKPEFDELKMWFPDVAKRIEELEAEVMQQWPWRWCDTGPPKWFKQKLAGQEDLPFDQPLCQSCNIRAKAKNL